MIVNKYPFSSKSSFSDVNQLLEHDALNENDIEKNLPNKSESDKLKEDKVEKYIKFKLCRDVQTNCCICMCSSLLVMILILVFG